MPTRGKLSIMGAVGEPSGGHQQRVQVALKPVAVSGPNKRMPMLQEGKEFEERVRCMSLKHPLNHHLIASRPKSPCQSCENQPEQSALTTSLGGPYLQKICQVMGLPLRSQSLTHKAPKGLSRNAGE